jgi:hypothetical protein
VPRAGAGALVCAPALPFGPTQSRTDRVGNGGAPGVCAIATPCRAKHSNDTKVATPNRRRDNCSRRLMDRNADRLCLAGICRIANARIVASPHSEQVEVARPRAPNLLPSAETHAFDATAWHTAILPRNPEWKSERECSLWWKLPRSPRHRKGVTEGFHAHTLRRALTAMFLALHDARSEQKARTEPT